MNPEDKLIMLDLDDEIIQQRYSTNQIKQQLKNCDILSMAHKLKVPPNPDFIYPASLEQAIIHQQSCYLQPDKEFLNKYSDLNECSCCQQKINRVQINWLFVDTTHYFVKNHGILYPLYFTFIKFQIIILLLVNIIYGAFFSYLSYTKCEEYLQKHDLKEKEDKYCAFYKHYYFCPQQFLMDQLLNQTFTYKLYLLLGYIAFLIIMITPFIYEIIIRYYQIKYWNYEELNHIKPQKYALYVKHLPKKMTELEIQQNIYIALLRTIEETHKSVLFSPANHAIEELLYIYDISQIREINQKRQKQFINLLITIKNINILQNNLQTENQQQKLKYTKQMKQQQDQFIKILLSLLKQTKQIQIILKQGLPFTNKIILKFQKPEQTDAVYQHYDKNLIKKIVTGIQYLWGSRKEYQLSQNQFNQELTESIISQQDDLIQNKVSFSSSDKKSDLNDIFQSEIQGESKGSNNLATSFMENDQIEQEIFEQMKQQTDEKNKQIEEDAQKAIHVQRFYREKDIFWQNIGIHTLRRFILRFITLTYTIIACVFAMGIFEYLIFYTHNNNLQNNSNLSLLQKILRGFVMELLTFIIIFSAVGASLITISQTLKSKRSTYTLQEQNIINFINITQQFFILSFAYYIILILWDGLYDSLPLFILISVTKTRQILILSPYSFRIFFKGIVQIFHIRSVVFWKRKNKIKKRFEGFKYFQRQLNQEMTPSQVPIRSRFFFQLFCFSNALLQLYICPYIMIYSLVMMLFFLVYDRYAFLKVYQIDTLFHFKLLRYLIRNYCIVMTVVYTFVYLWVFQHEKFYFILGLVTSIISLLLFIFFKKSISNFFIFKIFRFQKPVIDLQQWQNQKSYFNSYLNFYQELKISELTKLLIEMFQQVDIEKE